MSQAMEDLLKLIASKQDARRKQERPKAPLYSKAEMIEWCIKYLDTPEDIVEFDAAVHRMIEAEARAS